MSDAISIEQVDQQLQEKKQAALDAGTSPEYTNDTLSQDNERTYYVEEQAGWIDDTQDVPEKVRWTAPVALERANKLKIATDLTEQEAAAVAQQLVATGESAVNTHLSQRIEVEDREERVGAAAMQVAEVGPEVGAQLVQDSLTADNAYALDDQVISQAFVNSANQDAFMEAWNKEEQIRAELQRQYAEHARFPEINLDSGAAFLESVMPVGLQVDIAQLTDKLREKFPALPGSEANAFILAGDYLADIRDWITALPAEEQLEVFSATLEGLDEVSGIMTEGDFIKADIISQLFSGATLEYTEGDLDTTKYINNVISLLDVMFVGSMVKAAARTIGGVNKGSSLGTLERLDPRQAESVTAVVVSDAAEAVKLGTTQEDAVIEALLPKWKGYAENPLIREELVERQIDLLYDIQNRTTDISVHLTDVEKQTQRDKLVSAFEDTKAAYIYKNNSSFNYTDQGIELEAVYGKNSERGFLPEEIAEAKTSLERLHPEAVVETVDGPMGPLLKVKLFDDYKAGDNVLFNMEDIHGRGNKAKYIGDISANLSKHLSDSFYRAFDSSRGTEHGFLEMLTPFSKASNKNKAYAMDILDRLRPRTDEVPIAEIVDMLPKGVSGKDAQSIMEAVVSVRTTTDAAYVVENSAFRQRQLSAGRRYVKNGDFGALATPQSLESVRGLRVAFDARTGDLIQLTDEALEELYATGGQIAKSSTTHGKDKAVQSDMIIVTGDTTIESLPDKVLKYDANYLTTLYKDQYFVQVKKKELTLNGKKVSPENLPTSVVSTARSRKEAEAAVARLKEQNPDLEYSFKNDRALTQGQLEEAYASLRSSTGGLFFSKKGERLKDTVGNLAEIEDPVNALRVQASAVSRISGLRPITELMKQRFMNTFPQFSKQGFPTSKGAIASDELVVDDKVEAAKVMWDYINNIENGSINAQKWQTASVRFGEWLEDVTGSEKLGSLVRTKVSQKDPLSAMRGATFLTSLVMNPARQLFIQSQQTLFLSGLDPAFVLSGKAGRQGSALLLGNLGDRKVSEKALAKLAGISTGEYKQMLRAYRESGLTEAIDSHLLGRDAMMEINDEIVSSKTALLGQAAGNAVRKVIGATKSVGFDLGERINISNTYPIAWKRFKEANPDVDITSKAAKEAIAADTRQLALGMTRAGSFGYQDGIFSAATQFFSIQHKAFLAMARGVPGLSKWGNKAITPKEARRIIAFQTALFGAAGTGINEAVDVTLEHFEMNDISPEARRALHGGMFDLFMNEALKAATGDETDLAFAKNMSAGQGFSEGLLTYMTDISSGDVSMLEFMAGASANTISKFGAALTSMKTVLGAPGAMDEIAAKTVVNDFASIAGAYRQYLTADSMLRWGQWVDANRNALPVGSTPTEAVVYGILGIGGADKDATYRTFLNQKKSKDRLEGIADTYYKRVSRTVGDTVSSKDLGFAAIYGMQRLLQVEARFLQAELGEDTAEYYTVMGLVQDKIKQRLGADEGDLVRGMHKAVINNTYGEDLPSLVNYMQRHNLIPQEDAETILTIFEQALGGKADG
jgi:hypothetical protein